MKQTLGKKISLLLSLAMLLVIGLSGCSKSSASLPGVRQLLSNDYEADYIFLAAGLPVGDATPLIAPNGGKYGIVQSEQFTTLKQLRTLLEQTYLEQATVEALLATADAVGNPLYLELDGKLYRSCDPLLATVTADYDPDSVSAVKKGTDSKKRATMTYTVTEQREDGTIYSADILVTEVKKGQWRLQTRRAQATRTQVQAGTGGLVDSTATVGEVAKAFAAALAAGDTTTLETLSGASAGSYGSLAQAGVTDCTLTETLTEEEFYGEYRVSLTVAGGNKTFPDGQTTYHMAVGEGSTGGSGRMVLEFYPENAPPYLTLLPEQRTIPAVNQVYRLLQIQGETRFSAVSELTPEAITEYALCELSLAQPDSSAGFSLEAVQGMVKRMFGLADFTPTQRFYNEQSQSYLFYGRGGTPFHANLSLRMEGNGQAEVVVQHYSDLLQLCPTERVVYTLKNNWNDTYRFVSAQLDE
ncbi:MAG: hypothetical protein RR185_00820 [Angelakisella sp.]